MLPGFGVPPSSSVPFPKIGGQTKGVETRMRGQRWWAQPTLRDGGGGSCSALFALHLGQVRGHDGAWPSEDRFHVRHVMTGRAEGRSPFSAGRRRPILKRCRRRLLPGVWGCPPCSFLFPQEWGTKGVETRFCKQLRLSDGGFRLCSNPPYIFRGNDNRNLGTRG